VTQWLFCARATARCVSKTLFAAAMSADKPIWQGGQGRAKADSNH
jgi:hypothetical protein